MGSNESKHLYGSECHVGDFYNDQSDLVVRNYQYKNSVTTIDSSSVDVKALHLTSESRLALPLRLYLNQNLSKILDFLLVDDRSDHFVVILTVVTQLKYGSKPKQCPGNVSHYVSDIEYGVELMVRLTQDPALIKNEQDAVKLVKTGVKDPCKLTSRQVKVKCSILTNCRQQKETTLGEVCLFANQFKDKRHQEYVAPVVIRKMKKLNTLPKMSTNWDTDGLFYVYMFYRKIEIKLELTGYPDCVKRPVPAVGLDQAIVQLRQAWNRYSDSENNTYLMLYPLVKNLFWRMVDYLALKLKNGGAPDAGDDVVDEDKLTCLFQAQETLIGWFPINIDDNWFESDDFFIKTPAGFEGVCSLFREAFFPHCGVIQDDSLSEPMIFQFENNRLTCFGFADMSGAVPLEDLDDDEEEEGSLVTVTGCVNDDCDDVRIWFCRSGHVVRLGFDDFLFIQCACGWKPFQLELLDCHRCRHIKAIEEAQHQSEKTTEPAPIPRDVVENGRKNILTKGQALTFLQRQFKKHQNRYDEDTNARIQLAVAVVEAGRNEDREMDAVLAEMRRLSLDGDTNKLIEVYFADDTPVHSNGATAAYAAVPLFEKKRFNRKPRNLELSKQELLAKIVAFLKTHQDEADDAHQLPLLWFSKTMAILRDPQSKPADVKAKLAEIKAKMAASSEVIKLIDDYSK